MLKLGVIGYGGRINDVITTMKKHGDIAVVAISDKDCENVKRRFFAEGCEGIAFYGDAEEMLRNEKLDGVCIGTRCSSHTEYALLAAKYNLPIFLEKPVCTTYEDLERLKKIGGDEGKIVVSFPLRYSTLVTYVKELVDSGLIGRIEHVQAINNVPYGRGYYHKWYRDESETGGLFLQKATHDLDYINYLVGDRRPVRICATESKQIFKGDKPAGLKCADCAEAESCPESPQNVRTYGDNYVIGEYCCFATDTGNQDSGSILVEYDDGMHACYSQNFIVRNSAGRRGAILVGYKGTLEFDFYRGEVKYFNHIKDEVQVLKPPVNGGAHHGGDDILAENFIAVMEGGARSHATLADGILSAEMCLAATKSARERIFVEL